MKKVGITVVAAVCVVLLCVGFYFMKNSDGSQASKENLTVVQRINEKNLTDDYPKTPRAVIKLYNQIITSYYSGNYTDDEFDKLIDQARMLFDQDLADNNSKDDYKKSVETSIADYKNRSFKIRQTNVCDSDDVKYLTDDSNGDKLAYVTASYFTEENKKFDKTYQMYVLRKDDNGDWKIRTFYKIKGNSTGRIKMSDTEQTIKILAIESSCDETAAAVVVNGRDMRSNVISSQIALHTLYGGVVPEIASRKHIEKINQVIAQALSDADMTLQDMDAIGVTYGPGLVGALLVGVAEAKAISYAANIPLVGVHHIEGHISANYIENPDLKPPFLCLVVSGGHTHLVKVTDYGTYEILGRTRDDAAGEAFDKVARAIGLGYPGGPKIEKVSHEGDPKAISFPRAKIADGVYDFSFSGLKSAVLNYLNGCRMKNLPINQADVAASFQQSVTDVLVDHARHAIREYHMDSFAIAGGVASNGVIRAAMEQMCREEGVKFYHPSPILCTDNAAMIGAAAYYDFIAGKRAGLDLNAVPNLKLGE